MTTNTGNTVKDEEKKDFFADFKFPSAYTILFGLIALVALMTWIIPAGQYDRKMNEKIGKEVPISGTFHAVKASNQNLTDILLAPIDSFYDHNSYIAGTIDVSLFVIIIGGGLGVVTKTVPLMRV